MSSINNSKPASIISALQKEAAAPRPAPTDIGLPPQGITPPRTDTAEISGRVEGVQAGSLGAGDQGNPHEGARRDNERKKRGTYKPKAGGGIEMVSLPPQQRLDTLG